LTAGSAPRFRSADATGEIIDEERDEHVRRLPVEGTGKPGGPRTRRWRVRAMAVAAAVTAMAGGLVVYSQDAGAAYKPTISQVQTEVNGLQSQIDQVGEQFDQVAQQVSTAKARLASVKKQDSHAQALFVGAQSSLRQIAVASYETSNQSSIAGVLTAGNPTQVLQQASLLEELGNADGAQVARYLSAAQEVDTAQQNVQRTEDGIAQLQAQLTAKKSHLNTLLGQSEAELDSLNLQQQQQVADADMDGGDEIITHATYTGPTNTPAGKAVQFAYDQLDCPYLWGGTGPCSTGFDCSGLVQAAWAAAGVAIPRTTYEQWDALPHIPKADLEPGDLVFFEDLGHVGMYVGNGMMIDAPSTGEVIRMHPLDMEWYEDNYVGAARP
jgi:cell wall-associated NlpC family hydrolase